MLIKSAYCLGWLLTLYIKAQLKKKLQMHFKTLEISGVSCNIFLTHPWHFLSKITSVFYLGETIHLHLFCLQTVMTSFKIKIIYLTFLNNSTNILLITSSKLMSMQFSSVVPWSLFLALCVWIVSYCKDSHFSMFLYTFSALHYSRKR